MLIVSLVDELVYHPLAQQGDLQGSTELPQIQWRRVLSAQFKN